MSLLTFWMLQSVLKIRNFKLICKSTDCNQFLEFNLAHSIYKKKSIVYSQALHIKRLFSKLETFEKHLESLRSWFDKHGYPKKFVDNPTSRVLKFKPE